MSGSAAAPSLPPMPADTADPPDRELVDASLAGSEAAFRQLYRRHTPRVLRLVSRLLGGAGAECDDILQDTWLRAMRGAETFRWTSAFSTWLCGIAVRVYAESVRNRVRSNEAELTDDIAAPEPDLGAAIDIDRALCELPEHRRVVFVLHDIEGRTHDDIARELGVAVGTSKAYLHHARRQLRVLLRTLDREDRHDQ